MKIYSKLENNETKEKNSSVNGHRLKWRWRGEKQEEKKFTEMEKK